MTNEVRKTIAMELHRLVRRNFPRRAVHIKRLHDRYQADLVKMIPHAKLNKGYKYLMTVINAFSKFAYAISLKKGKSVEVAHRLEPILCENKMNYLKTDNGKEYYNKPVQELLKRYGVKHYLTYIEKKASIL